MSNPENYPCSICNKTIEERKAEGYELDDKAKLEQVGMSWCSYICPVCRDVIYDVISDYFTDAYIDDLIRESFRERLKIMVVKK